jgi:CRISPR-associated protein Cmr3
VLYGALRSATIGDMLTKSSLTAGINATQNFKITGVCLSGNSFLFPKPADIVVPDKKDKNTEGVLLKRQPAPKYSNAITNEVLAYVPEDKDLVKTDDGNFLITDSELERYLSLKNEPYNLQPLNNYLTKETKLGIGRMDDTHTTEEGKLYRIFLNRPLGLEFVVNIEALQLPTKGSLSIGGERRIANFELSNTPLSIARPIFSSDDKLFKIYLSTPAVFETGWSPEQFLKTNGLKLITAAISGKQQIGGWDLELKKPKPMLQAVNAGSVYYIERTNESPDWDKLLDKIHGQSICNAINGFDYAAQGFGIAYMGRVQ